jgi:DNA-binding CsgD family transcriptional regulator
LRWCLGGVALAEGMARNSAAANAAIAELDGLRADWMEIFEADLVDRGRAWARVAAGEVSSARDALLRAADRAATHGQRVAEARLLHELVPMVDGALVSAFAAHATAVRQRSAPELDAASRRFAALGASLLAAESAAAAATLYRGEGRARQASACARRAEEYAIACGGLDIPGLGGAPDADRLTAREREVAGLAASGASSKEIAGRLYISLRTVENHLQSVYSKLGVGSREELAGIL